MPDWPASSTITTVPGAIVHAGSPGCASDIASQRATFSVRSPASVPRMSAWIWPVDSPSTARPSASATSLTIAMIVVLPTPARPTTAASVAVLPNTLATAVACSAEAANPRRPSPAARTAATRPAAMAGWPWPDAAATSSRSADRSVTEVNLALLTERNTLSPSWRR